MAPGSAVSPLAVRELLVGKGDGKHDTQADTGGLDTEEKGCQALQRQLAQLVWGAAKTSRIANV